LVRLALLVSALTVASLLGCDDGNGESTSVREPTASAIRTITSPPQMRSSSPTPVPTPDLSRRGVYVLDIASGALHKVASTPGFGLDWTSDGTALWYTTRKYPTALGEVDTTPSEVRAVHVESGNEALVFDLGPGGLASINADARRAAYVTHEGSAPDPLGAQGGSRVEYLVHVVDSEGVRDFGSGLIARLSPDGTKLAFISPACANVAILTLEDLATGERYEVGSNAEYQSVVWERALRIRYERFVGADMPERVRYSIDVPNGLAATVTPIAGVGADSAVSVSPNGGHAIVSYLGRLFMRDLDTGAQSEMPGSDFDSPQGIWTDDSQRFAYRVERTLHVIESQSRSISASIDLDAEFGTYVGIASMLWAPEGDRLAIAISPAVDHGVCD
jgi:hypothetical protein